MEMQALAIERNPAEITGEELEYLQAIDQFKRRTGRKFLSWLQVLEVLRQLGWKKVSPPSGPAVPMGPARMDIQEMAVTVKDHGLLQPLLVRHDGRGGFICIIGGRRLQAARLAGLDTVSCLLIDGETSQADVLEKQLVENLQRKDLGPVERAN